MVSTPVSQHCVPVPACHIRLPHFAAAIKSRDLVSGIGYSTLPYFSPLDRFWYSSLTPSNCKQQLEIFYHLVNKNTVDWWNIHLRALLESPQGARPPKLDSKICSFYPTVTERTSSILDRVDRPTAAICLRRQLPTAKPLALSATINILLDYKLLHSRILRHHK